MAPSVVSQLESLPAAALMQQLQQLQQQLALSRNRSQPTTTTASTLLAAAASSNASLPEIEPTPPYWDYPSRISLTVTLTFIMALAVVGNLMVIGVILQNKGMRTRTNMLLCNLAVADLMCALLDMPFSLVTVSNGNWILDDVACQVAGFTTILFLVVTVHTLMYLAIHKCISIRHPYSTVLTHGRIMVMIFLSWTWGGVAGYLSIHGLNTVQYQAVWTTCGVEYPPSTLLTWIHLAVMAASCYALPIFITVVCYLVILCEIKCPSSVPRPPPPPAAGESVVSEPGVSSASQGSGPPMSQVMPQQPREVIYMQQRRITLTLVLVLLVFLLSWAPYSILLLYTTVINPHHHQYLSHLITPIVYWCGYLNAAVNPLIFALRSPAFREGYRHILCKDPNNYNSSEADYNPAYSKPMSKFRTYLRETLHGTANVHGSGSLTGSVCGSLPPSRKSSVTSLTNFMLLPKMRSLSTNSLPGNFRFSLNQRLLAETDTTKVSIISGIPVLTKGGKIVCYSNPHETPRRKMHHNPVYYPPISPKGKAPPTERSPLLQPVLKKDELMYQATDKVPAQLSHHHPQDVYLSMEGAGPAYLATEAAPLGMGKPHHMSQRPSCESGFNDDDDDAVFIVVADVEHHRSQEHKHQLLAEQSEALQELLELPHPSTSRPKPRVCKSVSDAPDMDILDASPIGFPKSTSDTCITEVAPQHGIILEEELLGGELSRDQPRSFRRSILHKLFTRSTKDKEGEFNNVIMVHESSPEVHIVHIEKEEKATARGDSDISDSGLQSGVHESPKSSHTLPWKKSVRSGSVVYQTITKREDKPPVIDPEVLQKASSDPCLEDQKSKKKNKSKLKHRKSGSKSARRHHEGDETGDMFGSDFHKDGGGRSKSGKGKMKPFPSVERLDFHSNSEAVVKKKHKQREKLLRLHSDNDTLEYEANSGQYKRHRSDAGTSASIVEHMISPSFTGRGRSFHKKSFSSSPSPQAPSVLYRSFSDPNLTFKKIEEKVVQRTLTRKWTKMHKTRKKRRSRQRQASQTDGTTSSTSMRSLDSVDSAAFPGPTLQTAEDSVSNPSIDRSLTSHYPHHDLDLDHYPSSSPQDDHSPGYDPRDYIRKTSIGAAAAADIKVKTLVRRTSNASESLTHEELLDSPLRMSGRALQLIFSDEDDEDNGVEHIIHEAVIEVHEPMEEEEQEEAMAAIPDFLQARDPSSPGQYIETRESLMETGPVRVVISDYDHDRTLLMLGNGAHSTDGDKQRGLEREIEVRVEHENGINQQQQSSGEGKQIGHSQGEDSSHSKLEQHNGGAGQAAVHRNGDGCEEATSVESYNGKSADDHDSGGANGCNGKSL